MEKHVKRPAGLTALFWRYLITTGAAVVLLAVLWWIALTTLMRCGIVHPANTAADRVEAVAQAVRKLKPTDRAVIYLFYYEGYSTGEIAGMLRVSQSTVTSRLHRARKKLKEQLEQAGLTARYDREFFHEFVTESDTDSGLILKALEEKGILGGLPLSHREILWCATEQNRKEDIDQAAQIVKEVCGG